MFTQAQYAALCDAIAQGVLSAKYGDKEMVFRSLKEMLQTKDLMEKQLGIKKPSRTKLARHTKGLQ